MPNHVTTILHAPKVVIDSMRSAEDYEFDFNKIIPFPAELENITAEVKVFGTQAEADAEQKRNEERVAGYPEATRAFIHKEGAVYAISQEAHTRLMREYGGTNWYNWNTKHWGTKWNAYSIERRDDETVKFETAWSLAEPVIIALSKKFPDAELVVEYADENWGYNYGAVSYKDGELIDGAHEQFGRGSEDAENFAIEIIEGMSMEQYRAENPDDFEEDDE